LGSCSENDRQSGVELGRAKRLLSRASRAANKKTARPVASGRAPARRRRFHALGSDALSVTCKLFDK